MWIQELPRDYMNQSSFCYRNNFLWQNENVYVMDNHLAAAWCWLQQCDTSARYNFLHIDRHRDLAKCFKDEDLQPMVDNPYMSFADFLRIKRSDDIQLFRWDNFIQASYVMHPAWFQTNVFLTQKEGNIGTSWGHNQIDIVENDVLYMDHYIQHLIGEEKEPSYFRKEDDIDNKWIVSLDLDVFYTKNEEHVQLFSDDFIRLVAKKLNDYMGNIQVLTIALSPDCCGGDDIGDKWNNAFQVLNIISEEVALLNSFPRKQL